MPRVKPVAPEALSEQVRLVMEQTEALMGFTPQDALTMAHLPAVMQAALGLTKAIYTAGGIGSDLKRLIGLVSSAAAGCQYCTGHTAFASERHGVSASKLEGVWEFETHPEFSEAERAALRVAFHAGQTPNAVTDEMFGNLGAYFSTEQQLEIVAVIALFGFLNRWNSTLAMELEFLPSQALARVGKSQAPGPVWAESINGQGAATQARTGVIV